MYDDLKKNYQDEKSKLDKLYPGMVANIEQKKSKTTNHRISKKSKNTEETFFGEVLDTQTIPIVAKKRKITGRALGIGRQKGTPNKVTQEMRQFYQSLCEGRQEDLKKWLDEIGQTNPLEAFKLVLQASEYFTPKIARQELTGKDGGDLPVVITKIIVNQDSKKI